MSKVIAILKDTQSCRKNKVIQNQDLTKDLEFIYTNRRKNKSNMMLHRKILRVSLLYNHICMLKLMNFQKLKGKV
jgi:hypothetical protein